MGGVNLPPTLAGTTQQRLNGSALVFGSTRIYGPRRRTAMLLGDSNSFAYNFREAFWRRARAWGGPIKLIGNLGVLGSVTGGSIGRRSLGDWKTASDPRARR